MHRIFGESLHPYTTQRRPVDSTLQGRSSPTLAETAVSSLSIVRASLEKEGIKEQSIDIIMASWRGATKKQYESYIQRWIKYCTRHDLDSFDADVAHVL